MTFPFDKCIIKQGYSAGRAARIHTGENQWQSHLDMT